MRQPELIWTEVGNKQVERRSRLTQILSISTVEVYPSPFICKTSKAQEVKLTIPSYLLIVNNVLKPRCLTSFIIVCFLPSPNSTTYQIQANLDISLSPRKNAPSWIHQASLPGTVGKQIWGPWVVQAIHALLGTGMLSPCWGKLVEARFRSKLGICHLWAKDELIESRWM